MEKEQLNRELTIQISEDEYATLNLMAERMELPISDVVRGLIPNFAHVKTPTVPPVQPPDELLKKIGPYEIRDDLDKNRLNEICNELIDNRMAKTLGVEIKDQLIKDSFKRDSLNITTGKRLLRWAHPARVDDRTRFVKPKAREMCMIIFGFIPERED